MRPSKRSRSRHSEFVLAEQARAMRFAPTASEERLWGVIKAGQLGVAFRRQVPIGRYIADFVASKVRLVVEVDGGYHAVRGKADARRDAVLRKAGYRVLRLTAELVHRDLAEAVRRVRGAVEGAG